MSTPKPRSGRRTLLTYESAFRLELGAPLESITAIELRWCSDPILLIQGSPDCTADAQRAFLHRGSLVAAAANGPLFACDGGARHRQLKRVVCGREAGRVSVMLEVLRLCGGRPASPLSVDPLHLVST